MSAVLKHIAAAPKGLSKAELHVLIELASRAEAAGGHDAAASSRELAEETGPERAVNTGLGYHVKTGHA